MGRYSQNQKKNTKYVIEPAVSGRSQCRVCRKAIPEGDYRVGTPHPEYDSYRWHHLSCAIKRKMIKETTPLEGENAIWIRAALRAVDEHRARTDCDCCTVQLLSLDGCRCSVFTTGYQPELPENALPLSTIHRNGIFQPGETIRGEFSQATAVVTSRKGFVPQSADEDDNTEEDDVIEEETVTATSVLAKAVQGAYCDVAHQVASAKARVEIAQETFVPQMQVWGIFDNKPYILLEKQSDTHWLVADGPDKESCIRTALLTPYTPTTAARFLGYLSDHRFRITLMMMAFFGYLTAMLIGMGVAAFSAMP